MLGYRFGTLRTSAVLEHSADATLLHCSIGGAIAGQLQITISVKNLLNAEYMPTLSMLRNLDIPEPGRNVRVQMAWTF